MSDTTVDLSIAIVSYNTRALLLDCLRSLFESTLATRFEVIVVDNDSKDGTVEAIRISYPTVHIIVNHENRGFSKGVNQALEVGTGRYLLMLNSDTLVRRQALGRMVACLDGDPEIGAVGCKQWTENGRLYQSCFPFPSIQDHLIHASFLRKFAPAWPEALAAGQAVDCTKSQDVDWVNGACLMVRTDLLRACGGLDEGYFMYFEDVDLCRTIHQRGYRIRHLADADIVHLIGRSGARDRTRLNLVWEFSRIRYVEKHFPLFKRWIMKAWIALGAIVRLIGAIGRRPSTVNDCSLDMYVSVVQRLWHWGQPVPSRLLWTGPKRG
ncbi:MAG: glycosyltransferase family 2 protein [Nitrospira sp.]|nr:glycosyltransferase family 2 protein [Nitrospira sp.]